MEVVLQEGEFGISYKYSFCRILTDEGPVDVSFNEVELGRKPREGDIIDTIEGSITLVPEDGTDPEEEEDLVLDDEYEADPSSADTVIEAVLPEGIDVDGDGDADIADA